MRLPLISSQNVPLTTTLPLRETIRPLAERKNILTGYGLVVGLSGTGDRRGIIAQEKLQTILAYYQSEVTPEVLSTRNIAAVLVTATVTGFQQKGEVLEAQVASVGDATSLEDGYLILTPLQAPNGTTYATASGPLLVTRKKNRGKIIAGAVLERSLAPSPSAAALSSPLLYRFNAQSLPHRKTIVQQVQKEFSTWNITEAKGGLLRIQKENLPFTAAEQAALLNLPITLLLRPQVIIDTHTRVVVSGGNVPLPNLQLSLPHGPSSLRWERYRARRPRTEKPPSFTTVGQLMDYLNQKEATIETITAVFTTLKKMPQVPIEIIFY